MRMISNYFFLISILCYAFYSIPSNAQVLNQEKLAIKKPLVNVGKIEEANINLYAEDEGEFLKNFTLNYDDRILKFPSWKNVTNQTYYPELLYTDLDGDYSKDLIIILTLGYGTGLIEQEVHIFHKSKTNKVLNEKTVINPKEILEKNLITKINGSQVMITIKNKKTIQIGIKCLGVNPKDLFSNITTTNLIQYDIIDYKLTAIIGAQIAPVGGYIGDFYISYKNLNDIYSIDNIEFVPITTS